MVKRICVIQARMSSRRLPGKSLMSFGNGTLIDEVIHRAFALERLSQVWLATSLERKNDELVSHVATNYGSAVSIFRGSETDVRSRYAEIVSSVPDATVFRVTADDPFRCPELANRAARQLESASLDYVGMGGLFPQGIETEVFSGRALLRSLQLKKGKLDQEHVTWSLRRSSLFRKKLISAPAALSFRERVTVDNPVDMERAREILSRIELLGGGTDWRTTVSALRDYRQTYRRRRD